MEIKYYEELIKTYKKTIINLVNKIDKQYAIITALTVSLIIAIAVIIIGVLIINDLKMQLF